MSSNNNPLTYTRLWRGPLLRGDSVCFYCLKKGIFIKNDKCATTPTKGDRGLLPLEEYKCP
jgi:hypothetical protein